MRFLLRLFFTWLAVLIASYFLDGIQIRDNITALVAAAVLALLDSFVKPVLILLTIPFTLVTLGLFLLVINAIIVLLGAEIVDGFEVQGFGWALAFSLVVSLIVTMLEALDKKMNRD
jgi:putative membrane protein